jgi:hypothetical protein
MGFRQEGLSIQPSVPSKRMPVPPLLMRKVTPLA